jgi:hypothetical protein
MRRNGDRGLPGGDREILDRGYGFHRTGDRWLPDRWMGMPSTGTGDGGVGGGNLVLIDSWPVENQNSITSYGIRDAMTQPYQAFTAPSDVQLKKVRLSLKRFGTPTGEVVAAIRDGSGVYPIVTPGGRITGSKRLDVTTISTAPTDTSGILYDFDFLIPVALTGGQKYCVVLEKVSDAGGTTFASPNFIMAGFYQGSSGHYGNGGSFQGDWLMDDLADMIFYLYA